MSFKIGQYAHPDKTPLAEDIFTIINVDYVPMELKVEDTTSAMDNTDFRNESFRISNSGAFLPDNTYYIHCKIRQKMSDSQFFNVKLVNNTDPSTNINTDTTDDTKTQYITGITVLQGDSWADIEFIFTPMSTYDSVVFELQRKRDDYYYMPRKCCILMLEVTQITKISAIHSSVRKIGIKSNPGFLFTLNDSMLRVGRSGIYELSNEMIVINSFSTCCPDTINESELNSLLNETYLLYQNYIGLSYGHQIDIAVGPNTPTNNEEYWYNNETLVWRKKIGDVYLTQEEGSWDDFVDFNDEKTQLTLGKVLIVGDIINDPFNIVLYKGDKEKILPLSESYTSRVRQRSSIDKTFNGFIVDYMYKDREED